MELQVSWSDVSELADDVCEDADVLLASEALSVEDLLSLIEDLKDPYGLVFSLYVLDNLSHQEISEQLEITLANSKSILHRARKQLQLSIINVKKNTHGKVRI
jgi:RNA polymerase sigma-70 factor (ECF subfamily)